VNLFATIGGSGVMKCTIANADGSWFLVSYDISQLQGFDVSKQQFLSHAAGTASLSWVSVTECT
jgi:hypothetical protein